MKLFALIALALPILAFSQLTKEQIKEVADAKKAIQEMKGKPFPSFNFETFDGNMITSDDTEGKILVVNFWFSKCKPCVMEMPEMNEMVAELKDEEIIFLAPTFDNEDLVNKFLQKRAFDYQIIPDKEEFCRELNVWAYPTHFLVNRDGIIDEIIIGYSSTTVRSLRKSVRKLLNPGKS